MMTIMFLIDFPYTLWTHIKFKINIKESIGTHLYHIKMTYFHLI
jgi:hypothetical protein